MKIQRTGAAALLLAAAGAGWMGWRWWTLPQLDAAEQRRCPLPAQPAGTPHPGMVWVPAGRFEMGDGVYPEEQQRHSVSVAGFWMDRTEVTNDEFAAFVKATGHVTTAERPVDTTRHAGLPSALQQPGAVVFVMPTDMRGRGDLTQWWRWTPGASWRHPGGPGTDLQGRGSHPVVAVTVEDAQAYARWKGRVLPTEAQWEWAARASSAQAMAAAEADSSVDKTPPRNANTWQGLFPVVNSADDGFVGLAPVGCYAANALGLYDLIGNVWELTADRWTPDHRATPGPEAGSTAVNRSGALAQHVIKGGSFLCASNYCMRYRAGSRQPQDADLGASHLGFRTVLAAPGP